MSDEACHLTLSLNVEIDVKTLEDIGVYFDSVRANPYHKIVVAISGNTSELGQWNPEKGILCKQLRGASDGVETWNCRFTLAIRHVFHYRYFVAELKKNGEEYSDSDFLRVLAWESRITPRTFSVLDYLNVSDKKSVTNVKFGVYDDGFFVQRGWLTSNSELHVRVTGSSCKFFNWSTPTVDPSQIRLFISCSKYVVRSSCGEIYDVDTTCEASSGKECEPVNAHLSDSKVQPSPLSAGSFFPNPQAQTQPVLLSTLEINRCRIHRGENVECWGTPYKPGDDVIFYIETDDIENTAVLVEFHRATSNAPHLRFVGSARFGPFDGTYGRKASQILNSQQLPVGDLRIQYLIIHPMTKAPPPSLAVTYQHHWKKRKPVEIGHRGMGTSFIEKSERSTKKPATTKENTLDSFREAVQHGADYAEMDVQLTKDHHVIVYHDYEAVIISKKKRGGRLSYLPIAIKDLNYEDLRELKVHHSSVLHEEHSHEKMDEDDLDPIELQSFPLLRSCFELIDPDLGFVIEIKYPMDLKTGSSEMPNFFEYNFYVDTILREILTHAGNRRILLSCFDPNVCIMLQLKQNVYPVFQLGIDPEYSDSRQSEFERLFWSAISQQLLGVCLESDRLLQRPDALKLAHVHSLIVLAWGEAVNCREKRAQLSALGVDGMIYDRMHENKEKGTLNVFKQKAFVTRPPPITSTPIPEEAILKPSSNVGDTRERPATSAPAVDADRIVLKCNATTKMVYGPTHAAIVKEFVELEKLSHTNSTTTCESIPPSTISDLDPDTTLVDDLEAHSKAEVREDHDVTSDSAADASAPARTDAQAQNSSSSAQRAMPLITLA